MLKIKRKDTGNVPEIKNEQNVPFLSFPQLAETGMVKQGFSTRLGGVSKEHLASMNLSFSRGDTEANVRENFRRMAASIGFDVNDMVFSMQTHTTNVYTVTKEDRGRGFRRPLGYEDIDGLITDVPGVVLATFYADCVPLYIVDPVRRAIGLSHSGWRGTVGKIGQKTVQRMTEAYGCDPADMIVAIGPSICQACYEVSEDVIDEFKKAFNKSFWDKLFYQKEDGKYQLDLWQANVNVFLEAGILPEHISVTNICTCCNPELLYSHRASKGKRGNLAAFLQITKD